MNGNWKNFCSKKKDKQLLLIYMQQEFWFETHTVTDFSEICVCTRDTLNGEEMPILVTTCQYTVDLT
jgi:hypothetical protein